MPAKPSPSPQASKGPAPAQGRPAAQPGETERSVAQLSISQELLAAALDVVGKAVSPRSINPVLGYVRIVAEGGQLTLTATDGDFTLQRTVALQGELAMTTGDGAGATGLRCLAPARLLHDLIARLPKRELTLQLENNVLHLVSGRSKYDLTTLGDENFPELPDFTEHRLATLSCAVLKRALQQTVFSAVKESSTGGVHYTNGVLFSFKGPQAGAPGGTSRLDIVATDGHRLALKRSDGVNLGAAGLGPASSKTKRGEAGIGSEIGLLIPARAADELQRLLPPDEDAVVELYHHGNQVFFRFAGLLLASSLLDVKFPDYERVIPKDIDSRVHCGREELTDALGRVLLVCRQKDQNPVARMETARWQTGDFTLGIFTDAGEIGKGSEELAVEIAGPNIRVAVNPGYLIAALKTLGGEQVTLNWISEVNPVMLTSPRDPDFTYIVMPIRSD